MAIVTIRDVAQEAGVSIGAVSRLLSGDTSFKTRPETETRVREAAKRLGYHANSGARLLRQQKPTMIGIAVSTQSLIDKSVNDLVHALQAEVAQKNYEPILVQPRLMVPSADRPSFPSPSLLKGIISADWQLEFQIPEFYKFLRSKLPVVTLYPTNSAEFTTITVDRSAAIFLASKYLVQNGYKRIMYVGIEGAINPSTTPRWEGWERAKRELDISSSSEYEISGSSTNLYDSALMVLENFLALDPRPDALIFSHEDISLHTIRLLTQAGIKVGTEVKVVSALTSLNFIKEVTVPVTFIEHPVVQIAKESVSHLLAMADDKNQNVVEKQMLIQPTILNRNASGLVSEVTL
jgi:LacI family transcriptional regulator